MSWLKQTDHRDLAAATMIAPNDPHPDYLVHVGASEPTFKPDGRSWLDTGTAGSSGTTLALTLRTTAYTILATDDIVECTSGTFTVTLPTAVGIPGRVYTVKNKNSGVITVDADGVETIDAQTTMAIAGYTSLRVYSNGTEWSVL